MRQILARRKRLPRLDFKGNKWPSRTPSFSMIGNAARHWTAVQADISGF
jgi:hypothetical protein